MPQLPRGYLSNVATGDAGGVTNAMLENGSVGTTKLADKAVTNAKVANNAAIANTKLANPNSYVVVSAPLEDLAAAGTSKRQFKIPCQCFLVHYSAVLTACSAGTSCKLTVNVGDDAAVSNVDLKSNPTTVKSDTVEAPVPANTVISVEMVQVGAGDSKGAFVTLTFKVPHTV